jgi:glycosyltransferase involved in cell wall biosynthesis
MDWRLMSEVPAALPEFDFVFVGPQERRTKTEGTMPTGPNIFYTGAKLYSEVPAYMAAFDVCWVPFDASRVSISANPVKIYEYLSLGKPVVSTPIADPEIFAGVVVFAEGAAEIAAELKRAIGREEGAARVEFARANSWDTRASQYVEFIAKRHHDGTPSLNPLPARADRRP